MLNVIWKRAVSIVENARIINAENDVWVVIETGKSTNVSVKAHGFKCECQHYKQTDGLCEHCVAVSEIKNVLDVYLIWYNSKADKENHTVFANLKKKIKFFRSTRRLSNCFSFKD